MAFSSQPGLQWGYEAIVDTWNTSNTYQLTLTDTVLYELINVEFTVVTNAVVGNRLASVRAYAVFGGNSVTITRQIANFTQTAGQTRFYNFEAGQPREFTTPTVKMIPMRDRIILYKLPGSSATILEIKTEDFADAGDRIRDVEIMVKKYTSLQRLSLL